MTRVGQLGDGSAGPGHFISRGGGQQPAAGLIGAAWALLCPQYLPRTQLNLVIASISSEVLVPLPPLVIPPPPSLPELLLTEVVAGARVVVLLEGGVQPGVDAHLKHGDGQI